MSEYKMLFEDSPGDSFSHKAKADHYDEIVQSLEENIGEFSEEQLGRLFDIVMTAVFEAAIGDEGNENDPLKMPCPF